MTDFFTDGISGSYNALDDARYLSPLGSNVERRIKRVNIDIPIIGESVIEAGDVIAIQKVGSAEIMTHIFATTDGLGPATTTISLGMHEIGVGGVVGTVLDADLFDATLDYGTAATRIDQFALAVLDDHDRGRPFWYLLDQGASTYTADPKKEWYITATFLADPAAFTAASRFTWEMYFEITN